jgi:hypothetical protein
MKTAACRLKRAGFVLAAAAVAAAAPAAPAPRSTDVYYEQTTVVSKNGQLQGPGVSARVWFSGRRIRIEAGDPLKATPLILRLDQGRAWRLDPARKLALELDVEALRARAQMELSTAGELMGGGEEARVRTSELPGRRVVAGHTCRGYRIKSPVAVLDLYVATDLPVGVDSFADYLEWSGAAQGLGAVLDEIRKLPGLPLETRARVSVLGETHETLSTVTKVQAGAHAASLFEPPRGYEIVRESDEEEE